MYNFGASQILNVRNFDRKSETEEESEEDSHLGFEPVSSPAQLNARKLEIMHQNILKKNCQTISDEEGWTTDF